MKDIKDKIEKLDCHIWVTSPAVGATFKEMKDKINELIEEVNKLKSQDHVTTKDYQDDDKAREERNYRLDYDKCGKQFWSNQAFPEPQICPSCYV